MADTPVTPDQAKSAAADAINANAKTVQLIKQADGKYVVTKTT